MKELVVGTFYAVIAMLILISSFKLGMNHASSRIEERDQARQERLALMRYEYLEQLCELLKEKAKIVSIHEDVLVLPEDTFAENPGVSYVLYDDYNKLVWDLEMAKREYNALANAYNSLMAEYEYRFADESHLPKGAAFPLPRSFELYQL